jgi:hypothetical protein
VDRIGNAEIAPGMSPGAPQYHSVTAGTEGLVRDSINLGPIEAYKRVDAIGPFTFCE